MNGNATRTPTALLHNLEHNKILHEKVLFVTVKTRQVPFVDKSERVLVQPLAKGFTRLKIYYGYMEEPNIPFILNNLEQKNLVGNSQEITYFLGRESIISTEKKSGMAQWREKLFSVMSRNATTATAYFGIPANRVVELGEQVEI